MNKIKKYKVIALSVAGLNNKIHHSGAIVTSDDFNKLMPNPALVRLLKEKFVKQNADGTFTVLALSVNGMNKILSSGEIVRERDLVPPYTQIDDAASLVEHGFLEPITE